MKTQRGATLIELLVALALLSSIAVLSAQLVIQSTKLIDTTARASRNPDLVLAMEWVRRDLYEATSVMGEDLGWTNGPIVLVTQNGGWVEVKTDMTGINLRVRVVDNGFGIEARYLDKIFDRFFRVKNDKTRYITGTGLGLPIVKGLVEALSGRISVESKPDEGTTFTVSLPVD